MGAFLRLRHPAERHFRVVFPEEFRVLAGGDAGEGDRVHPHIHLAPIGRKVAREVYSADFETA